MRKISLILIVVLTASCYKLPETESPTDVVLKFDTCYGRACMNDVSHLTTAGFRDNRPESVWVAETWETLHKLGYKRITSKLEMCKIRRGKAVVILRTRISIHGGSTNQGEIYFLIQKNGRWKIAELKVTDEVIDPEKFQL